MNKIVIVGGGAAGMMAAATLVERGLGSDVILIERNAVLGRKVMISGGGRCNVTTGQEEVKAVLRNYPRGAKFLRHAMYDFPPLAVREWVESHGVPLKKEKDLRVFPQSDSGKDVVSAFERYLVKGGVELKMRATVEGISKNEGGVILQLKDGSSVAAKTVILTTGGQAYRGTGSQGDGYDFAESLGHTITPLAPSLNSFMVEEEWIKTLPGISFSEVRLRFMGTDRHEFTGPILFTHKGITGPAVFALSSLAAYEDLPAKLAIDFFPNRSYEELMAELSSGSSQQKFVNHLGKIVYKSMAPELCSLAGIPLGRTNAEVGKKGLARLIESLKNTQITLTKRLPGDEFVTAGGVALDEVDPKTMESRVCPGLYFAGELLNIDGFTGGYNLQVAWCTGRLAGSNVPGHNL